jgi:NNP family nitrate/nitrite transporter-like MFS transporter
VVPFINRKALGSVAGIVGAGGNAGAVAAGFLFRIEGLSTEQALMYLGMCVALVAPMALLVRFSPATELEEKRAMELSLAREDLVPSDRVSPAPAD